MMKIQMPKNLQTCYSNYHYLLEVGYKSEVGLDVKLRLLFGTDGFPWLLFPQVLKENKDELGVVKENEKGLVDLSGPLFDPISCVTFKFSEDLDLFDDG